MGEKSCPHGITDGEVQAICIICTADCPFDFWPKPEVVAEAFKPRPEVEKPIDRMHAIQDIKERLSR